MLALTICRMSGNEESRPMVPGEILPGHWRSQWKSTNHLVLVELEMLDFFGNSNLFVPAR